MEAALTTCSRVQAGPQNSDHRATSGRRNPSNWGLEHQPLQQLQEAQAVLYHNCSTLQFVLDDKLPQAPLEVEKKQASVNIKGTYAQDTLNASNGLIQYHQGDSQLNNSIQLNNCPRGLETEMGPSGGMGHKLQLFERPQFPPCGRGRVQVIFHLPLKKAVLLLKRSYTVPARSQVPRYTGKCSKISC